MQRRK